MVMHGYTLGPEICKVLGLEADKVRSISMHVAVDSVAAVDVTQFVESDEIPGLVEQLRRYVLVPRSKVDQEQVLAEIRAERDVQDQRWGADHDNEHGPLAWVSLIEEHLAKTGRELEWGEVRAARKHIVIVAALAVAWLEAWDRRSRR